MAEVLVGLVRIYQKVLSPFLGRNCRFHPTCSQYAIAAIAKHGALRGIGYALWRVARCQPLCAGGYDPVP